MGLELAVRFAKPPLQTEVEEGLAEIDGLQVNGNRGHRWESEELEGFFTIDYVEPAKQKKKPRLAGLDITVPWGGPTEEIQLLIQILDSLASKIDLTVTSDSTGEMSAGEFGQIEQAWHSANVAALVGFANQDDMSIRHVQTHFDDDDPDRVETLDATRMSVDAGQRDVYQGNCAMRVAQALQRCGDHKLAVVTAHRVIERMPQESFAYILLGISFSSLGDNDTAIKVYQRAIDVNPEGQNVDYSKAMIEQLTA